MRPRVLVLVALATACTRLNPGFGDPLESSTSGSASTTDTGLTSGTTDGMDGPTTTTTTTTTTGGPTTQADSTSVSVSATSSEGTTSGVGSSGECAGADVMLVPMADAFIETGTGACDGGSDCQTLNFGASPQGLIHGVEGSEFQSYLLMTFDLTATLLPEDPLAATLTLVVGHPGAVDLEVHQVFPVAWDEGGGMGDLAVEGESTWLASSHPVAWTSPSGPGTFEVVLADAVPLGDVGLPMGPAGSHAVMIALDPAMIAGWNDGPDFIHLVVTKVTGDGEAIVSTREMAAVSPTLSITGC